MIRVDFQPTSSRLENVKLENFLGGPSTFEVITKFCYGQPIDLRPNNVDLLRCGSEFLEMTEEFEDENLISKTEAFLTFIVLASWRDSIILLKTCENLSPWAENLQIVRCCDSISWKAFQNKNEIIDGWGGRREKKTLVWENELHFSIRSGTSQEGEIKIRSKKRS